MSDETPRGPEFPEGLPEELKELVSLAQSGAALVMSCPPTHMVEVAGALLAARFEAAVEAVGVRGAVLAFQHELTRCFSLLPTGIARTVAEAAVLAVALTTDDEDESHPHQVAYGIAERMERLDETEWEGFRETFREMAREVRRAVESLGEAADDLAPDEREQVDALEAQFMLPDAEKEGE